MDKTQSSPSREDCEKLDGLIEGVDGFPIYGEMIPFAQAVEEATEIFNKILKDNKRRIKDMKRRLPQTPQYRILPYKMGSNSATLLAEGLRGAGEKCFKIFPNKAYTPRPLHTIINWGNGDAPNWNMGGVKRVLNHPQYVRRASNKLTAFNLMRESDISLPEFTTDEEEAQRWYEEGYKVVGRAKLQGHSGEGIYLTDPLDYPVAEGGMDVIKMREVHGSRLPLYVKYVKKQDEYRVHVFNGQIIDVQQKRKKRGIPNEEVDFKIRNHTNGWVYCRDNVSPPESVNSNALAAITSLGLDFGAVDVIWNNHHQQAYVLEVNTAPGLEGMTLNKYINAIRGDIINNKQINNL